MMMQSDSSTHLLQVGRETCLLTYDDYDNDGDGDGDDANNP